EVGNDVVHRAAVHAERDAAIHAARALDRRLVVRQAHVEFAEMFLALSGGLVRFFEALVLHESRDFSHAISSIMRAQTRGGCPASFLCGHALVTGEFAQRAPVFLRECLNEARPVFWPSAEYPLRTLAAGIERMALY